MVESSEVVHNFNRVVVSILRGVKLLIVCGRQQAGPGGALQWRCRWTVVARNRWSVGPPQRGAAVDATFSGSPVPTVQDVVNGIGFGPVLQ